MHKSADMGEGESMGTRGKTNGQRASGLVLALAAALFGLCAFSSVAPAASFEIPTFSAEGLNQDLTPSVTAGARPNQLTNDFTISTVDPAPGSVNAPFPAGNIKDVTVELPPGIVGNAAAFPKCTADAMAEPGGNCPEVAQIGAANLKLRWGAVGPTGQQTWHRPVYNMVPPPGVPAQFAFRTLIAITYVNFHVRTGGDYGVTATIHNINETAPVLASDVTIWGVPGDPSHDGLRLERATNNTGEGSSPYPEPPPYRPLLSNPTSCTGPLLTTMAATTWQHPDENVFAVPAEADEMTGCNELDFAPGVKAKPTTNLADSPSGLDFHLTIPQSQDSQGTATAHLRESKVVLPPSLVVNPSSANGLEACSPSQIGFQGPSGEKQFLRFDPQLANSFTVAFGGNDTSPIPAAAARPQVMAAIETLPGLSGNIRLEGAPGGWIVTFKGAMAGADVPELSGSVDGRAHQALDVSGEGGGFNLQFDGTGTESTFEGNLVGGELLAEFSNPSRGLKAGELIEGPGIAPGTTITPIFGSLYFLSKPATETLNGAELNTTLPFDASAEAIQEALEEIPAFGAGNVFVRPAGKSGITRSYEVSFGGTLAGAEPAPITGTDSLTGPGAGVLVTPAPAGPGPLSVITLGGIAPGTPQFTPQPAECPDAAKLGTVRIESKVVIDHPLEGNVYLATPRRNPFDSLLALYIAVDDPKSGVVLKLPGLIEADPKTGQLTATFSETPQLPFEELDLEFFRGAGAPLKTGIACGNYDVTTDMTPWTAPQGAVKHPGDSFAIERGAGGGACVSSEAGAPNAPRFEAGTLAPTAGAYSPFGLKLSRADGTQRLSGIDTTLPKGLLAKLAGVPYCSDAALAAAASKSGRAEQESSSCPFASKVGTVSVGAGAGPTPFYAGGNAYLAGPYKGAPLSLAVVTPAVAGPFDLGTVVVRNALYVNPETTQVHAISDPFPSILQGIPLDLRSVALNLDKSRFTRNPTSCNPFEIAGTAAMLTGQSAPLLSHFQVGECARLKFGPKLALGLRGGTSRGDHPALRAVLTAKEGQANIARTSVALPHSEFLAQDHIKTICTRVQFAADACPKGSIYGKATAITPLLDRPLSGPVYLRSSSHKLPDLVVALHGQIEVDLVGRIDSIGGGIRTTFETVPDAPVSKFVLSMQGGKKGLLENSRNLCASTDRATVEMDGQNGKFADTTPVLKSVCGKHSGRR